MTHDSTRGATDERMSNRGPTFFLENHYLGQCIYLTE